MSTPNEPVVIVPAQKYSAMRAELDFEKRWWNPGDSGQSAAEAFMEEFQADRGDEWGHVAYCIRVAVERMRKDAVRTAPLLEELS